MKQKRITGFTLIELLVVVAVLALLMSILLPTLKNARMCARGVRATAGLREILVGYTQYHDEHRGAVLFGYTPPTVNGGAVKARDPDTGLVFGMPVADRYPWRLAAYVSNMWGILHIHKAVKPPQPQIGDSTAEAFGKAYELSLSPAFGINSVYVGGHTGPFFKGFTGPQGDRPNVGKHIVFRAGEVKSPSSLIVFAETQSRNAPFDDPETSLHYAMPPRASGERWRYADGEFVTTSGLITGVPQGRYTSRTITGFFDGHAEAVSPEQLLDIRLWANWAETLEYDIP